MVGDRACYRILEREIIAGLNGFMEEGRTLADPVEELWFLWKKEIKEHFPL